MKRDKPQYHAKNKVFLNGNVSAVLDKRVLTVMKARNATSHDDLLKAALDVLDTEFEMVPVTGEPELTQDGEKGWRLFSYKTSKEYVLKEPDLDRFLTGKCVRLTAYEPSDETFSAMIWQGA